MDISYNGKWGYAPLIISLASTREVLYVINRSGNAPSHLDSAKWLDKTLDLVSDSFEKVYIRGDTDFSLTGNFDKWDKRCRFVFGMDARKNLVKLAGQIPESEWELFQKEPRKVKTSHRRKPENVKAQGRKSPFHRTKAARYFLLNLCHPDVFFTPVIGEWHLIVIHEAEGFRFKVH